MRDCVCDAPSQPPMQTCRRISPPSGAPAEGALARARELVAHDNEQVPEQQRAGPENLNDNEGHDEFP
jgi:hypothetical protein